MCVCPCHNDKKASLTVSIGDNGGIVFFCHAGCRTEDILSSIGLTFSDISPEREETNVTKGKFDFNNVVAAYEYRNGTCKLRDRNKSFLWQHKEPDGTWKPGRGKAPHVLYQAGEPQSLVCVTEGEKDADNLSKLSFCCVSSENGAGTSGKKWFEEYTTELTGKDCVLFPDNDTTGQEFMQFVAAQISGKAKSVKVLNLLELWQALPEKGDISDIIAHFGAEETKELLSDLIENTSEWMPFEVQDNTCKTYTAKAAADFGADNTHFVWYPYIPVGDYTVLMAPGGTGKTYFTCGIAAAVSQGEALPGDFKPQNGKQNVLIISAEDRGELLKKRLEASHADLSRVYILDCRDSEGLDFTKGYQTFKAVIAEHNPAIVIIDPWHGFLGEEIDINRVNAVRPCFQKLANIAKDCNCGMILVSHVNKRAQGENVNFAATGSTDFVNAARSALYVIFDEEDPDGRIVVHSKTNYASYGKSVKFRIDENGGLVWAGFSDIDRSTMEQAARQRKTPGEVVKANSYQEEINSTLIRALLDAANPFQIERFTYDQFKELYGSDIFGTLQPKRALDAVKEAMAARGWTIETGKKVKYNGDSANGFFIIADEAQDQKKTKFQ